MTLGLAFLLQSARFGGVLGLGGFGSVAVGTIYA